MRTLCQEKRNAVYIECILWSCNSLLSKAPRHNAHLCFYCLSLLSLLYDGSLHSRHHTWRFICHHFHVVSNQTLVDALCFFHQETSSNVRDSSHVCKLEAVFFHSTYIMSFCSGDAHGLSVSHSNQTLLFWGGIYIWILSEMLTLFWSPRHIRCADGRYWLMRYAAGCYIIAEKLWL